LALLEIGKIKLMKNQEKKYQVKSFNTIKKILKKKGAKKSSKVVTTHYYSLHKGNDVVKLVKFDDKNEIHILKENQGKFKLVDNIPMKSVKAGLKWLKDKGYTIVNVVKMANTDYEYKNGIVGLYIIDDWLYSVILDYPEGKHEAMEKEFLLENTIVIKAPYNKHLEKMGKLHSIRLRK
jgi:hypothetical protein